MRSALLAIVVFLAGCTMPAPGPATSTDDPSPTYSANAPLMTCTGSGDGPPPTQTLPTLAPGEQTIDVLVAHRDRIARYLANGTDRAAVPTAELQLGFADGLGYRLLPDASAVHDDQGLHRFDADLRRTAWWNSSHVGGAVHHGSLYYATAGGRLYVLSDQLVAQDSQVIPGWAAPIEPRYDVILVVGDALILGSAGRPTHLLVYGIADPADPLLLEEIPIPHTQVPVPVPSGAAAGARQAPWAEVAFGYAIAAPERIWVWRDGAYQAEAEQTVSRFQDLISVRRTDWSVERVEQQYLEDNQYGTTDGAHIGPIDANGTWALRHVRGMFTLANLVQNATHVTPGCQIDIQMSSYAAEDAFFDRRGELVLTGTQGRASAWNVGSSPARVAEIAFPNVATDVHLL